MPVINEVPKLWGRELWHHNNARYSMKTLILEPGAQSSLHYHERKEETFLVIEGSVWLELGGRVTLLTAGSSVDIRTREPHRFRCAGPKRATVIEAGTEHDDEDVVRLEASRLL